MRAQRRASELVYEVDTPASPAYMAARYLAGLLVDKREVVEGGIGFVAAGRRDGGGKGKDGVHVCAKGARSCEGGHG
jgi:hypothetical protein